MFTRQGTITRYAILTMTASTRQRSGVQVPTRLPLFSAKLSGSPPLQYSSTPIKKYGNGSDLLDAALFKASRSFATAEHESDSRADIARLVTRTKSLATRHREKRAPAANPV